MRSSKQRSRSKSNRNRSVGNVINRVFDSSGPEGKVRGTPQQILDKYSQLAQDAHLGNDRVAAENFQQHSEHYMRLLSVAQKEQEARREQQEREHREHRERQQHRDDQRQDRPDQPAPAGDHPGAGDQPAVLDASQNQDTGLVETPEAAPQPKPRRPKPAPKPAAKAEESSDPQEAAE